MLEIIVVITLCYATNGNELAHRRIRNLHVSNPTWIRT